MTTFEMNMKQYLQMTEDTSTPKKFTSTILKNTRICKGQGNIDCEHTSKNRITLGN